MGRRLEPLDVIDQVQPTPSIWAFGTVLSSSP